MYRKSVDVAAKSGGWMFDDGVWCKTDGKMMTDCVIARHCQVFCNNRF